VAKCRRSFCRSSLKGVGSALGPPGAHPGRSAAPERAMVSMLRTDGSASLRG